MIFHKFIPILLFFVVFQIDAIYLPFFQPTTHFNFTEKINCLSQKYWYYQITYHELDYSEINPNDDFGTSGKHHFVGENHETFISTTMDEGDEADRFEIEARVHHNCTSDSKDVEERLNLGYRAIAEVTHNMTICRVLDQPNVSCK